MFESDDIKYHSGRLYGLYRAYVYDNKDPENMGRLRLCIPSALGEDEDGEPIVSEWAYPMFPVAGDKWGVQNIPRVENPDGSKVLVWVAFEMGDPDCPVWLGSPIPEGGLIKEIQKNHIKVTKGKTRETCFGFSTPNGNRVILDDTNDCVTIVSSDKNSEHINTVNIDSKNDLILIETENNTISINKGGINFKTNDENKLSFKVGETTVTIVNDSVNVKTDNFNIAAGNANLDIKDGSIKLSVAGGASFTLVDSSASLSGSLFAINTPNGTTF